MKGKRGKILRKIFLGIALLVGLAVAIWFDLVVYGLRQAKGQLNIVWNARPVEEFMADPSFPDSLKQKLRLIEEVRQYAIDSLGLKDTRNYKTLYDQKGEEIMWVVTASERYQLKAKEWKFPVLGSVPYKGFFRKDLALELRDELKQEGWDVSVRNPGGWSTLGWFTDPILSKMLERSEGDLANLIIHEMVHSTIFVKDSVDFNENLATFIGDRGTERFLIDHFGKNSPEYNQYMNEDSDYLKFTEHMLRGSEALEQLYASFSSAQPTAEKDTLKWQTIKKIVFALDTLSLTGERPEKPSSRYQKALPNNAYFMNFRRYQSQQDVFWKEFREVYQENLRRYIAEVSRRYPFL